MDDVFTDFKVLVKDNKITIKKYLGQEQEVIVPSTIDGLAVEVIGKDCFKDNASVGKIFLADSIKIIEDEAFANCANLAYIKMPDKIKTIKGSPFKSTGLKSILIKSLNVKFKTDIFQDANIIIRLVMKENAEWYANYYNQAENYKRQGNVDTYSRKEDYKDQIIFGYDLNYDIEDKEIIKIDSLSYFINKKGEAVVFLDPNDELENKHLVVKEEINGHPVKAVAYFGFYEQNLYSLYLPDTIEILKEFSFVDLEYDYLRLSNNIKEMPERAFSRGGLAISLGNLFNSETFSKIAVLEKNNKTVLDGGVCHDLFLLEGNGEYRAIDLFNNFHYEKEHRLSYVIKHDQDGDYIDILDVPGYQSIEEIPTSIEGVPVKEWDVKCVRTLTSSHININVDEDFVRSILTDQEEPEEGKEVEIVLDPDKVEGAVSQRMEEGTMFKTTQLYDKVILPENVIYLTCYAGGLSSHLDANRVVLHNKLVFVESLENNDDPYHLPSSISKVKSMTGKFIIDDDSRLVMDETFNKENPCIEIVTGVSELISKDGYSYYIRGTKDGEILVLKDIEVVDGTMRIPSYIDNYPVLEIDIEKDVVVNKLILDNEFLVERNEKVAKVENFIVNEDNFVDTLIIAKDCFKGLVTFDSLNYHFIATLDYKRIEFEGGIEDIPGVAMQFSFGGKPKADIDEGKKKTIHLPPSLKHIGSFAFSDNEIRKAEVYSKTKVDEAAFNEYCEVIYYDEEINGETETIPCSVDGMLLNEYVIDEEIEYEQPKEQTLLEKVNNARLNLSANEQLKAEEVLVGLEEVDIDNQGISARYQGSSAEPYTIRIMESRGRLDYYCSCPSFRNGRSYNSYATSKCKHVNALIMYIKDLCDDDSF